MPLLLSLPLLLLLLLLLLLPLPLPLLLLLLQARLMVRQQKSRHHLRRLSSLQLQLLSAGACCACEQHPAQQQQHCFLQLHELLQANR